MFNKINTILISTILVMIVIISFLFKLYKNEKEDRIRYNNNMISLIENRDRQQILTVDELKRLYPKYDSLAKELKIKTKFITNVIETRYKFKDTLVTTTIIKKDNLSEKSYFNLNEKCYSLSGYLKSDSISFTKKEFNDKFTTFLYKDWEKKYLWGLIKIRPYYNIKVWSECVNDTISVENNIKIKE
jgi:hypothetical protein